MKKTIVLLALILIGCSSAQLVSTWKNPDYVIFDANKVLVVAMTPDEDAQITFETKMKRQLSLIHI